MESGFTVVWSLQSECACVRAKTGMRIPNQGQQYQRGRCREYIFCMGPGFVTGTFACAARQPFLFTSLSNTKSADPCMPHESYQSCSDTCVACRRSSDLPAISQWLVPLPATAQHHSTSSHRNMAPPSSSSQQTSVLIKPVHRQGSRASHTQPAQEQQSTNPAHTHMHTHASSTSPEQRSPQRAMQGSSQHSGALQQDRRVTIAGSGRSASARYPDSSSTSHHSRSTEAASLQIAEPPNRERQPSGAMALLKVSAHKHLDMRVYACMQPHMHMHMCAYMHLHRRAYMWARACTCLHPPAHMPQC